MASEKHNEIIKPKKHGGGPKEHYPTGKKLEKLLEDVRILSARGASKANISAYIGINFKTFDAWMNKHEELAEAFSEGRNKGILAVKGVLYEKAIGQQVIDQTGKPAYYANGKPKRLDPDLKAAFWFMSKFAKDTQSSKSTLELAQANQVKLQNELIKAQVELAKAKAELARYQADQQINSKADTDHTTFVDDIEDKDSQLK